MNLKTEVIETGRYIIVMKYDRGPGTTRKNDRVVFKNYNDAAVWFNKLTNTVFCIHDNIPPPPKNTKRKNNKPQLSIVRGK